jgi:uncharacterized repeat protein (TIGR03806 family)
MVNSQLGRLAQPNRLRFRAVLGLVLSTLLSIVVARADEPEKPYGIEKRIPWTTSHVVGSPEPPLPYRTRKAFPKLNLHQPIYVAPEPGTDQLVAIQHLAHWAGPGKVVRFKNDPDVTEAETLLELDRLAYGLTFHPKFEENGYIYFITNGPVKATNKQNRIARFTIDRKPPHKIDPKSELVILEWDSNGHNGGDLRFGPDGYLYVPTGDGTSDSDTNLTGQDLADLCAVLIRIDVDHPDKDRPYSIPPDNPFVGVKDARPEIWAYGFRNPWRMDYDHKSNQLWVGQNGQDLWEQVMLIRRGENYGWSVYEGGHPFYLERKRGPTPIVKPTVDHPHSESRSLTGGVVYRGSKLPDLDGAFIYGDFSTGKIWGVRHDGQKIVWNRELADTPFQIVGFRVEQNGELIVVDQGTGFHYLEPTPKDLPQPKFPTRLSETGLFTSVKGHQTDPALVPYSVNAPLWSDGAHKERFIALPDDLQIDFTAGRGWNFPDGAVLVKTFSLDLEAGNPATRKRIETRLLTRQQGEWIGYSYQWNDEQTDATLVASPGLDRTFTIRDSSAPGGKRDQTWHYPSRAECMVCHSRAANYVLGLTEVQMNKLHDYGGVVDEQLRTLEHIGMFKLKPVGKDKELRLPKRPHEYRRLVDPYDTKQDLDARARSYLHANCSNCHVGAGGGNSAIELEFFTKSDKVNMFDVKPNHHTFGLSDAKIIASGSPERSTLYYRIAHRGQGQMPPLATSIVDQQAVQLMQDWIKSLKPEPEKPASGAK